MLYSFHFLTGKQERERTGLGFLLKHGALFVNYHVGFFSINPLINTF